MSLRSLLLALILSLLARPGVLAQSGAPHIRPADLDTTRALHRAATLSPSARALIDAIERSDVIVHVVRRWDMPDGVAGMLTFVTRAGGYRYLRVGLDTRLRGDEAVAVLGHELQHAVEVAGAAAVVDRRSFERFYEAVGDRCSRRAYDTEEARAAGARVFREIRRARMVATR